jgi:two-component system chemotaxis sensor kinase CheA
VSLSPDDEDGLGSLRSKIEAFAADETVTDEARELARSAMETLSQIGSEDADAAQLLASASQTMAKAALIAADEDAQDQGETAETPTAEAPAEDAAEDAADKADAPAKGSFSFDGPALLPADADLDLLKEFITECLDHISMAEGALLELETNSDDAEQINVVFRAFHTVKGTSGFLGLDRIQKLAHLAETMLDRGRDGEIRITGGYADLALQSCDGLRQMIEGLEGVSPGSELFVPENLDELLVHLDAPEANGFNEDGSGESMRVGDILVAQGKASREQIEEVVKDEDGKRIGEKLVEKGLAKPSDVAQALRTQKQAGGGVQTESSIRVTTSRLDSLIDMVGELVIAHSMVAQDPTVLNAGTARLTRNVSHSGKIVRELQDLTMSLRMVPLKATFQKMARLVRDVGKKANKQIQFITEGEDTEIDRNMVEALSDPLVHMMRNSCDHGVELADERQAAGKNPTGTVRLRAYHAAGNVVIEIIDDGKGLDREKILAKAVERGIVEPGKAKDLSENDVFMLVFQPGFSTAEKVTDVSGRGVGMDVVRKNIESLRGRIEVSSKKGKGTTFTIRLPLTMAITDAMLLRVGKERYLLPTISIEQSFRPTAGSVTTVTGKGEMVMLRGELLPVYRLYELYDVEGAITDVNDALLVVIEGEGKRCAVMADELLSQQQVVIKSLGSTFGNIEGISGGAILGDGRVGLILDATGIQQLAQGIGKPPATPVGEPEVAA